MFKKYINRILHFLGIKKTEINMLNAHKLKDLKEVCINMRKEIIAYQTYDPLNPDKILNLELHGALEAVYRKIQDIEKNNGVNLDEI